MAASFVGHSKNAARTQQERSKTVRADEMALMKATQQGHRSRAKKIAATLHMAAQVAIHDL
jgi:hypothetical protein